nr:MAG TPA: hypothetical protein [Caudoviricetes sp.]
MTAYPCRVGGRSVSSCRRGGPWPLLGSVRETGPAWRQKKPWSRCSSRA